MKYIVTDISGMGGRQAGGYEWGCQVLCARALRFMENLRVEGQHPEYTTYQNIIGIAKAGNDAARKMDEFVLDHEVLRDKGITGAMHQFSIAHAKAVFERGREAYLQGLRDAGRTDADFFEWDDAEAFPEKVPA